MTRFLATLLAFTSAVALSGQGRPFDSAQGRSRWVYFDDQQRLHYGTDARGNRIMDFSHAGYKGGGVALPMARVARTLSPVPGDNTSQIQAAIDEVSRLARGADGLRGAVLLQPGTYEVVRPLTIAASGVVLRGSGSEAGGTTIRVTGPPPSPKASAGLDVAPRGEVGPHRLLDISGSGSWQPDGQPAAITDKYVPSGADRFNVETASRFHVGDTVLIRRPVTEAWIRFMEMDKLVRDNKPQTWIAAGTIINTDRVIKSIAGISVTLDVPLSDSFDASYLSPPGASLVKYTFPGRIEQVGLESVRVTVPAQDVPITEGQYTLLRMNAVSDGWVRDVAVDDTQNTITLGSTVRRVTLENVHIRHSVPFSGAASPADIAISGTQILVHRSSVSGKRVWPIVTQAGVTDPT